MKIRISDLSVEEKLRLRDEVIDKYGEEHWLYCEASDTPIAGCVNRENSDYWVKVMVEGDMSKIPELMETLITESKSLIGVDLSGKFKNSSGNSKQQPVGNGMIIGKWYGATDGTSNDVVTMFKYNGKSNGRIGWGVDGRWSTNIDDRYDAHVEPVPVEILTIAFIAESINRGYAPGVRTKYGIIDKEEEHEYLEGNDHFFFHNIKVYKDGDWNNSPILNGNEQYIKEVLPPALQSLLKQIGISLN